MMAPPTVHCAPAHHRSSVSWRRHGAVCLGLLLCLAIMGRWPGGAGAQESEVEVAMAAPVATQIPLLLKILQYEKTSTLSDQSDLSIGVLYQTRFRASLQAWRDFSAGTETLSDAESGGRLIQLVELVVEREADLDEVVSEADIDLLYIAPLRVIAIQRVVDAANKRSLLTMTGVASYVERGVMVGIGSRRNRPHILMNLTSIKESGFTFRSELLKVAQLMDSKP